jgi:hypothetical protein
MLNNIGLRRLVFEMCNTVKSGNILLSTVTFTTIDGALLGVLTIHTAQQGSGYDRMIMKSTHDGHCNMLLTPGTRHSRAGTAAREQALLSWSTSPRR